MRILHIIPTYLPAVRYGGPIQSVHQLACHLAKLGHDVHVFTTNVDGPRNSKVPLKEPVDREGVKVHYFGCPVLRNFYFSPSMEKELSKRIRDFDLLHLHSVYRWLPWMAARVAKQAGVPYVISPRGMLVKDIIRRKRFLVKSFWIQWVEKSTFENAAAVHTTSELEAQEIRKFNFRLPPVYVVPNGVDEEVIRYDLSQGAKQIKTIAPKNPYLLFLGRIHWKKGLNRLIPAMSYISNIQLVIAGNDEDHYSSTLLRLAKDHGVENRISFVGSVYGPEKFELMRQAAAFILLSYSENFGNAVLEAMAVGCPVVVTPEVGLAGVIRESGAGIVSSAEPEILAENINKLLSNPEYLERMRTIEKDLVHQKYRWEIVARQMLDVYFAMTKEEGVPSS